MRDDFARPEKIYYIPIFGNKFDFVINSLSRLAYKGPRERKKKKKNKERKEVSNTITIIMTKERTNI